MLDQDFLARYKCRPTGNGGGALPTAAAMAAIEALTAGWRVKGILGSYQLRRVVLDFGVKGLSCAETYVLVSSHEQNKPTRNVIIMDP